MWSRRLRRFVKYNYETVSVYAKDPQDAKNAMDKAIAERPHARLAHVTPFTKPNGWYSAAETVALILTFETQAES